jgi:hypothetical protein
MEQEGRNMSELIKREDAIKATWQEPSCIHPYNVLAEVRDRINALPTASPWHRVEDGLPEIGKIVLVYDDWDRLSICQLDNQYRWLRQGGGWFDVPHVRYWMPLSEPPKEGL